MNRNKGPSKSQSRSPVAKSLSSRKLNQTQTTKLPGSTKIHQQDSNSSKNHINHQHLGKTLDSYTMLIRSNNPIRCLTHNCNISMYCQTEQKLLCANCIFGRSQHKFHRVTPVDKSLDKIGKDIETMNRLVDRQLNAIKMTAQELRNNLVRDESDTQTGMENLIKTYEECHQLLQENFQKSKERVLRQFEKQRTRYERIAVDLKRVSEDYGTPNILQNVNKQAFKQDQLLLYQHSVCSAIIGQKKIDQKDYVSQKREIHSVANQEKKKILGVLDLLKKITSR